MELSDRNRRNKLAVLLRHLCSGRITNDHFTRIADELFNRRDRGGLEDRVLLAIRDKAWFLYGDLSEHKLHGPNTLTKNTRREVARWIMFLYTDLEYVWPEIDIAPNLFEWIVTLGISHRRRKRAFIEAGDENVWPFIRQSDYDEALRMPTLLAGVR